MVSFGINYASFLGIFLMLFGISLIPLGLRLRQPFRVGNLIQDIIIALVYLLCGFILVFHGWRLDPILHFCQLLLTFSTVYWALKDLLYRSSTSRN